MATSRGCDSGFGCLSPISAVRQVDRGIVGGRNLDGDLAGEDLLVARRGEWALVMDMDQRERMTQLVAASASPPVSPQIAGWKKWIDTNDVTIVAYAAGVRELLSWADDCGW